MDELLKQINELLKIRKKLIDKQKEVGMWETDWRGPIVVHSGKKFVELAEYLEEDIYTHIDLTEEIMYPVRLTFEYRGVKFFTSMPIKEYEELSEKHAILKKNVEKEIKKDE